MSFYPLALLHMDVSVVDIMLEMAGGCVVLYKIESIGLLSLVLLPILNNFS